MSLAALLAVGCGSRTPLNDLLALGPVAVGASHSGGGGLETTGGQWITTSGGAPATGGAHASGGVLVNNTGGYPSGGGSELVTAAPDPSTSPPEVCSSAAWCGPHADFVSIWGTSETDIWIVANSAFSRPPLYPADNYDAATRSALVHWDGSTWTTAAIPETTLPGGTQLHGIWGSAQDDYWAVGDAGILLHFNGAAWTSRGTETSRLNSVHGDESGSYWIAGDRTLQLGQDLFV